MLLGNGLQAMHVNIMVLTQLMLDTVKRISSNDEGGIINRIDSAVNESLEEIKTFHDEVNSNLIQINTVVGNISELTTTSEQIKKFSKFLNIVALNMLVESAQITDSTNTFSDMALEIKDLSLKIAGVANDVDDYIESSREIHISIHEKTSKGMDRLHALTGDVHTAVRTSVKETEQLMNFSINTIEQANMRSQEISRQVGKIVVGIQFHDNMRQRIIHIINTLNTIEKRSSSVLYNQVVLFNNMAREVDDVYLKNLSAIKEIKNEVEVLLESFLGLKSDKTESSQASGIMSGDPFALIKSALVQLHKPLDQGHDLFEQLQEAAVQAADIATKLSNLLNIIRDISSEAHNKALNSIIAAQRLGGKGRTLKLLAQEMNDLAVKSDVFVDEVGEIVESIVESATEIGQRDLKRLKSVSSKSSTIATLDAVIDNISSEYDQFRQDSIEAYECAKSLKKAINTTMISLEFLKGLSKGLTSHKDQLEEIAGYDDLGTGVEKPKPETQTFEKEGVVTSFSEVLKKKDKTSENEFGDNVEIFEPELLRKDL